MVKEGKGRLFKRKDGKYFIYVPVALAEDSMFPFLLLVMNYTENFVQRLCIW